MSKKLLKVLITIIICFILIFVLILKTKTKNIDTIQYDDKTYTLLEYNMDIFTYNHNSNKYYEEDKIYTVYHDKWDVIYCGGDLFILDKQIKNATKYYTDDKNYDWYIIFDVDDLQVRKSISIDEEELEYLYDLENAKKEKTITFDEIDMFADILKVSKDGLVQAVTVLAQVDNVWYYKTEIMTSDDKEYVVKLSDSLNKKINDLNKK